MGMCDGHPVGSNRFASKTHEFDMRHVSGTHEGLGVCFFAKSENTMSAWSIHQETTRICGPCLHKKCMRSRVGCGKQTLPRDRGPRPISHKTHALPPATPLPPARLPSPL